MLTLEEIRAMSAKQLEENQDKVFEALRKAAEKKPPAALPETLDIDTLRRMSTEQVIERWEEVVVLLAALK